MKGTTEATLDRLPVLPLRGLTAFPHMIIHFDVGRMLSIRALEASMKCGQRIFLTAQRELKTDTPAPDDLYQIGTVCVVRQILRLPGDNIRVLVEGKSRALVHQFEAPKEEDGCIYAQLETLEDYVYGVTERRAQALVRTAQERFSEYAQNSPRISPDVEVTVAEGGEPGWLADFIAQNLPVEVDAKQEILEELSVTRRLTMVIRLLGEETEILKIENEIQDELKTQMDKNQREYYLREQIKVIQTELGEQDTAAEAESYRERVLALHLPQECEDKLIKEVDRFAKLGGSSAEQGVGAHLSGHGARPAVEQKERGAARPCRGAGHPRPRPLRPEKGQGAHHGISGGQVARARAARAGALSGRPRRAWARPRSPNRSPRPWGGAMRA